MNAAFRELGLDWRYVKLPVRPELFAETVRALPGSGYRGANVTIPHKLAAHELADVLSPAAGAIGAVNTLTFAEGRILGDNTDAGGLIDALEATPRGSRAGVLGAGGAGRAAAWALREAGADVWVWNRTADRALALAGELGLRRVERPEACDLLVNATSVGLVPVSEEDALAVLALGGLEVPGTVVDLVYGDEETPLCRWARAGGAIVVNGLEVLVRQAARSLALWTGREAPVAAMRRAASAAHV